jgi:tRNA(fMet)-specific endonuclease VapC
MTYLLDTSTCVGILRNKAPKAKARLALMAADSVLCSVVLFELQTGAVKSMRPSEIQKSHSFMSEFESLPFDDGSAQEAADIRCFLEARGIMIGGFDLMIAAIARQHGLIAVTRNVDEFSRVPNLVVEDWEA